MRRKEMNKLRPVASGEDQSQPCSECVPEGKSVYGICKYCGAPLKSSKCEYCGSGFGASRTLVGWQGPVMINDELVNVYVSNVHYKEIGECGLNASGELRRTGQIKRTFTLVEM